MIADRCQKSILTLTHSLIVYDGAVANWPQRPSDPLSNESFTSLQHPVPDGCDLLPCQVTLSFPDNTYFDHNTIQSPVRPYRLRRSIKMADYPIQAAKAGRTASQKTH